MRSPRKQVPIAHCPDHGTDTPDPFPKDALRLGALAAVRALAPAERVRRSAVIRERIRQSGVLAPGMTALAFAALPSEPNLLPLLESLPHVRFAFPLAHPGGRLTLHLVTLAAQLRPTSSRVPEPDPDSCPEIAPEEVDVALVPGLAFDPSSLHRLGRGGGFFDRLLARPTFRARRIGIAFSVQLVPIPSPESHDQPVDALITDA
ncbi:5-formyltetrahydrofolate cyclo-ligase [soil metagenome]